MQRYDLTRRTCGCSGCATRPGSSREGVKQMKRYVILILCIFGYLLAALYQFQKESPDFQIIQLRGIDAALNYSHQQWDFFPKRDGRPPLVPVWDGDILFISFKVDNKESEFITTYSCKDGLDLFLETRGSVLYLGGKPVSLATDSDALGQAWEWLETAKTDDLKSLRFLSLEHFKPDQMAVLQKVARANPNIGLALKNKQVQTILPLFQPSHLILILDEPLTVETINILKQQGSLRTLWISLETSGFEPSSLADLKFLSAISGIERVVLSTNNERILPSARDFFPKNLRSLTLSGFSLENLSFLKHLPHLKELSLERCKVNDSRDLMELIRLTSLELVDNQGINIPSLLRHLPALRYVGSSPIEDRKSLIASLQSLRHLQMLHVNYPQLSDFSGLEQISSLRSLIITGKTEKDVKFQTRSLYGLKQLRYLALDNRLVADQKELDMLERALPDCRIAAVEGVCMGSGWILLLIPAILAALFTAIRRRRQGSPGPNHVLSP